ncbi:MAG: RpiB/LacA/LacB family sugar-phosphate isomerase, partial [Myxococcales bacterium]
MKIVIANDHAGLALKAEVLDGVRKLGHEVQDLGTHSGDSVDYPDFASQVARKVGGGEADVGILICGTGIGMSIVANKYRGVRAAV